MRRAVPQGGFYQGRQDAIELLVLHTAECPCEPGRAMGVMNYLARADIRASAHYCCDPDETVAGVLEEDTAWAAPNANANGIHVEQAGYARFGRLNEVKWTDEGPRRMLIEQVIPLLADVCKRQGIPPVLLSAADIAAGKKGITHHAAVSQAFGTGDHWDCGENYPLLQVVTAVAGRLKGTPDPTTTEAEMPDYLVQLRDLTICAVYPNGNARPIGGGEYNFLISKGVNTVPTTDTGEDERFRNFAFMR